MGQWLGKIVGRLNAHPVPDAYMSTLMLMGFMVGVWVMFGVVYDPIFGASIPVILYVDLN